MLNLQRAYPNAPREWLLEHIALGAVTAVRDGAKAPPGLASTYREEVERVKRQVSSMSALFARRKRAALMQDAKAIKVIKLIT